MDVPKRKSHFWLAVHIPSKDRPFFRLTVQFRRTVDFNYLRPSAFNSTQTRKTWKLNTCGSRSRSNTILRYWLDHIRCPFLDLWKCIDYITRIHFNFIVEWIFSRLYLALKALNSTSKTKNGPYHMGLYYVIVLNPIMAHQCFWYTCSWKVVPTIRLPLSVLFWTYV